MDYLLVDMGNTAVKWCLSATHRQSLGPVHALAWPADGSVKALVKAIQTQVHTSFRPPDGKSSNASNTLELVYCSVAASAKTQALVDALTKALHCGSRKFQSQAKFALHFDTLEQSGLSGLRLSKEPRASQLQSAPVGRDVTAGRSLKVELVNGYKVAGQLGVDRWAALIGFMASPSLWAGLVQTRAKRIETVVLVSAGTATVMDWLHFEASETSRTRRFYFEGGTLRPGYGLMAAGLGQATAGLGPQSPPTTRKAIEMGIAQAQIAGVLSRGIPSLIVVHGGFARQWKKDFNRLLTRGELEGFGAQTTQPNQRKLPEPLHTHGLVLKGLKAWRQSLAEPLN